MTQKKRPNFLKFLFLKLPIFMFVFALIMIGALKMVERYPDPLREGLESFFSRETGTVATIGVLNKMTFFPIIHVDMQNVTMHNLKNAAQIDLEFKSLLMEVPFWTTVLNSNRVKKLSLSGLKAEESKLLPLAIEIDKLEIVDHNGPDKFGSFIEAKGGYGGKPMVLVAEITKKGDTYFIPKSIPFSLKIGDMEVNASLRKELASINLNNAVVRRGEKSSQARDFVLIKNGKENADNPIDCLKLYADGDQCDKYLN